MNTDMNIIKVYYADTEILYQKHIFDYFYALMPAYRKEKIDKCRFLKDKVLSLGAGIILKNYGVDENKIKFKENGKPYTDKICFNVSHSGKRVFAAFSKEDVGCDVEMHKKVSISLAKRCFFDEEYNCVVSGENLNTDRFFEYWTLKESFMKATGQGLKLPLDSFCIHKSDTVTVTHNVNKNRYFFKEYNINDGYSYSVCGLTNSFSSIEKVSFEKLYYD